MILTVKWGFLFSGTGLGQDDNNPPWPLGPFRLPPWFPLPNLLNPDNHGSETAAEPTYDPSTE